MPYPGLAERVAEVRARIAEHQARSEWTHPVTIVAVTKTHPPEAVRAAVAVGLTAVGENRVQEAIAKQEQLADVEVEWHLIGSLQRNKAKHAVGRFALIHSVDSVGLAEDLDRRASPGSRQPILVQVNCSDESQKGGVLPAELPVAAGPDTAALAPRDSRIDDDGGVDRECRSAARRLPDSSASSATSKSGGASGYQSCRWGCRETISWQ